MGGPKERREMEAFHFQETSWNDYFTDAEIQRFWKLSFFSFLEVEIYIYFSRIFFSFYNSQLLHK